MTTYVAVASAGTWIAHHAKQFGLLFASLAVAIALFAAGLRVLSTLLARLPATDPPIDHPRTGAVSNRVVALTLGACVLAGGALRLVQLDRQVFWNDEVWTSLRVAGIPKATIDARYDGRVETAAQFRAFLHAHAPSPLAVAAALATSEPQWPPTFYFMEWAWSGIFGTSAVALRTLAALLGIACIPAMYGATLELVRSRRAGLVAAALVALSPAEIVYAREARGYSLILLLTMLSTIAVLRAMRTNARGAWLAYGLCSAVGIYTYTLYAPIAFGQLSYVLATQRTLRSSRARAALVATGAAIASFVPWLVLIAIHRWTISSELAATAQHYSLSYYAAHALLQIAMTFSAGSYFDLRLAPLDVVAALLVLAFTAAFVRFQPRAAAALACFALPCVALTIISDAGRHEHLILLYRYQTAAWFALQVAVAGGVTWTLARASAVRQILARAGVTALFATAAVTATVAIASTTFWDSWTDEPSATFARTVNALRDPIVIVDAESQDIFTYVERVRSDVRIAFVPMNRRTIAPALVRSASDVVIETMYDDRPPEWHGAPLVDAYTFDLAPSLVVRLRQRFHDRALAYGRDPFNGTTTFWIARTPKT